MNIGTEHVYIVNRTESQSTLLQQNFTVPVHTLQSEDTQDSSNPCTMPQSSAIHLTTIMPGTHMCRLCATVTEFVVPIFEGEGLQNRLADKIHQHLPIQVSESDVLPTALCFPCTSTLLAWHELALCSVQADTAMRARYNLLHSSHSHKEHQQNDISANIHQPKHEKLEENKHDSPRVNVPCEYCSRDFRDSELRNHTLTDHPERLFLCAECNLYRNKDTMMIHMGMHIEADEDGPQESEKGETKPVPKIVIPIVRIQRVPSRFPPPPPPPETAVTVTPPTHATPPVEYSPLPIVDELKSSDKTVQSKSVLLLLRAAETVELDRMQNVSPPSYSESMRASELAKSATRSGSDVEKTASDTVSPVSSDREEASPEPGAFSDRGGDGNEFGPLPESAIEDTGDGCPNEERGSPVELSKDGSESTKSGTPGRCHPCPQCGKTYTSASGRYYHSKHAHADKELACESCHGAFASKERLTVHERTHTNEKRFSCRTCGKAFGSAAGRYIHEQTHSGRREHACAQCGRAFRWRAQLARHEARHAARRELACGACGARFSVSSDLVRHARRHQPGCYRCDYCPSEFKQKRYLKVHVDNKHFAEKARLVPVESEANCDTKL